MANKIKKEKKMKNPAAIKLRNLKIAEVIYMVIGGIISVTGLVFGVLGCFIINMEGRFSVHPFYPLYLAERDFFNWLGLDLNFTSASVILLIVGMIYFLIVFYVFASKAEDREKREKQRKLREKNLRAISQEGETAAN